MTRFALCIMGVLGGRCWDWATGVIARPQECNDGLGRPRQPVSSTSVLHDQLFRTRWRSIQGTTDLGGAVVRAADQQRRPAPQRAAGVDEAIVLRHLFNLLPAGDVPSANRLVWRRRDDALAVRRPVQLHDRVFVACRRVRVSKDPAFSMTVWLFEERAFECAASDCGRTFEDHEVLAVAIRPPEKHVLVM